MRDISITDTDMNSGERSVDILREECMVHDKIDADADGANTTIKQMKTEEKACASWAQDNKMMSLEVLLNEPEVEDFSPPDDNKSKGGKRGMSTSYDGLRSSRSSDKENAVVPSDCVSPRNSSPSSTPRAVCSICRSESGRCHASDPDSMQAFFVSSLGYGGVLSHADWLCMKCYSKWYNRCKRKAAAVAASMGDQSVGVASNSTSPRRKRTREKENKEKQEKRKRKEKIIEQQLTSVEILDQDTDSSDDAMLLTRITSCAYQRSRSSENLAPVVSITQIDEEDAGNGRDLEMEVDELHVELFRARNEMMRLAQEVSRRDAQMEEMVSFVKTEMASMHGLIKDIAEMRVKKSGESTSPPKRYAYNHVFHLNGKILGSTKVNPSPASAPATPTA